MVRAFIPVIVGSIVAPLINGGTAPGRSSPSDALTDFPSIAAGRAASLRPAVDDYRSGYAHRTHRSQRWKC